MVPKGEKKIQRPHDGSAKVLGEHCSLWGELDTACLRADVEGMSERLSSNDSGDRTDNKELSQRPGHHPSWAVIANTDNSVLVLTATNIYP
jgi:hypothetical protein